MLKNGLADDWGWGSGVGGGCMVVEEEEMHEQVKREREAADSLRTGRHD